MKIKICGITNTTDCREAVSRGADYIGFIFYPPSPRYVTAEQAARIVRRVSRLVDRQYGKVGVFVNESIRAVTGIYHRVGLDVVQLHGDESLEYRRQLALPYWKALRVKDSRSLEELDRLAGEAVLLDTYVEGTYGGTGVSFSLGLAEEAIKIAAARGIRVIISGGISLENIEAIGRLPLSPYAFDVNSSLEEKPGKKSREKIEKFFETFNRLRRESP
jgi:phosphoribosylanthranilate isomerase